MKTFVLVLLIIFPLTLIARVSQNGKQSVIIMPDFPLTADTLKSSTGKTEGTVTDIDGNVYRTVIIGEQEWMAENLRVNKYNNGEEIPTGLSVGYSGEWINAVDGAFAVYPHTGGETEDDVYGIDSYEEMVEAYGYLYNWFAATNPKGLCPSGWRLPKDEDFVELFNYIASYEDFYYESNFDNNIGNALKSCLQVGSPLGGDCDTQKHPRWDFHNPRPWEDMEYGTDDFGFSYLPAGNRTADGIFQRIGNLSQFWTSTEHNENFSIFRYTFNDHNQILRHDGSKLRGMSVRCIRNGDDHASIPSVTTTPVTDISRASARSGGNVSEDGGDEVTSRGVVWGQADNPTLESHEGITEDGDGLGDYESEITGFDSNITYYVRAYATNAAGTAYGEDESFAFLTYSLTFEVVDENTEEDIENAVITINGDDYEAGNYLFSDLPAATYSYKINHDRYFEASGDVKIENQDVALLVRLKEDDTATTIISDKLFRAYPVPARNIIYLESEINISELRLINRHGQQLRNEQVDATYHEVDLTGLSDGVYFLQAITREGVKTIRVLVVK